MPALEPFDPSRPLVAATFIRLHAVRYQKGNKVPYTSADDRILKRLYEQRKITYGEGESVEATTPREAFLAGNAERRTQERAAKAEAAEQQLADLGGEPPAEPAESPEDEQAAVAKLVKANNHDKLFKMASGLPGVTKDQKKAEIALALVRAGRGTA